MKNNISKLITITVMIFIISLFVSIIPTLAKEMTLSQLGQEIDKLDAKNNVESSYAYIIGNYVFTSNVKHFTTQDVMLAARSIKFEDSDGSFDTNYAYGKMAIQLIERTYDFNSLTTTGWKVSPNRLGNTQLLLDETHTINVKFIDYNYFKNEETVDTDNLVTESMSKLNSSLFTVNTDKVSNGKISINVNQIREPIVKGMASGILASLSNLVNNKEVKSIDFIYTNENNKTVTYTVGKDINVSNLEEWLEKNSETIFGREYNDVTTFDLIGKSITITLNLDDNDTIYLSEKSNLRNEKYTINFTGEKEELDTDSLVIKAMENVNKDLFTVGKLESGKITITINNIKTPIIEGMNSSLFNPLINLVSQEGVESIDFTYINNNSIKYNIPKEPNISDLSNWFLENCEKIFGENYTKLFTVDLIGKSFTATINLDRYSEKVENNVSEYIISFDGKLETVDTDLLIQNAMKSVSDDLFTVGKLESGKIDVNVDNIKTPIIEGMTSGIFSVLTTLVPQEEIESIDLIYTKNTNVKYTLNKQTNINEVIEWFKSNCEKIFEKNYEELITMDLFNKSFIVKINLNKYSEKKETNPDEYIISFTGKKEQINTDILIKNAMKEINDNLFIFKSLTNETATITVKNLKTPIIEGMNSSLFNPLINLVSQEGVESVDFIYADNENIKYNLSKEPNIANLSTWFLENCEEIFGTDSKELITANLIDKSFKIKINLDKYSEKEVTNSDTYTITFEGQKETINTDTLIKKALETINTNLFTSSDLKNGTATITVKDIDTKIIKGMNSGVIAALINLASNDNIKSIDFIYNDDVKFILTGNTNSETMAQWFIDNSQTIFGKEYNSNTLTMNDIINKSFIVKINLKDYALKETYNPTQYNLNIEATKYTVKFDYNDGKTEAITKTVVDGSTVIAPELPQREGYKFGGWYEDNAILEFDFSTKIKKNTNLTAHWVLSANEADYILYSSTITNDDYSSYYSSSDNIVKVTINKPSSDISAIDLVKNIKELVQKQEVKSVSMKYSNQEYIFYYNKSLEDNINKFIVNITGKDKLLSKQLSDLNGKEIQVTVSIDPNIAQLDTNKITEIMYSIQFKILQQQVVFKYNNGQPNETIIVDNYSTVDEKTPTRPGYKFLGWYLEGPNTKFNFNTKITKSIVLTAHWIQQHKVVFNYGYNGMTETVFVDHNTAISKSTPVRDGYKFLGWYEDGKDKPIDLKTPITSDLKLTARWVKVLLDDEATALEDASNKALKTINNNNIISVTVDKTKQIITINHYDDDPDSNRGLENGLAYILTGSGVHTALREFLSNKYIDSIEMYLDGMEAVPITADMIKDMDSMIKNASKFLAPFKQATGLDPLEMTYKDLIEMKKEVKVKINLANGKSFQNEKDAEYTFKYTNIKK